MVHGRSLPPRARPTDPDAAWTRRSARQVAWRTARTGLPAGHWRVRLESDSAPVVDAMPRSGQELEVPLTLPAQESGDARPTLPAAISRRRGGRSHSRVVAAGAQTSWSAASQGGESSAASSGSRAGAADQPPLWTPEPPPVAAAGTTAARAAQGAHASATSSASARTAHDPHARRPRVACLRAGRRCRR